MSGSRIAQAKAALRIFLKSLPPDCIFSVIGFGSSYNFVKGPKNQEVIAYNEENLLHVNNEITKILADMGGTNILEPLRVA